MLSVIFQSPGREKGAAGRLDIGADGNRGVPTQGHASDDFAEAREE